jgi:hypothetical protein
MPLKGGRSGGSRGVRSSAGSRASRGSSSSGSRGFRINIGDRAPRSSVNIPNINTNPTISNSDSNPTNYNPTVRPRMKAPFGTGWRIVAIIIGLFLLGMCACVGLGFLLQALGYG